MMGWLFFVWIPLMQRDNGIHSKKVLRDTKATIDAVRSELDEVQKTSSQQAIPSEPFEKASIESK
jgi:hypothetical protein